MPNLALRIGETTADETLGGQTVAQTIRLGHEVSCQRCYDVGVYENDGIRETGD